ncbi:MAG TPA: DUF4349 domain-containing protein [Lachnospiraceae bacterium]|nr:DUF4349 domain-containing protein [Lachnospiraceae bacterium]
MKKKTAIRFLTGMLLMAAMVIVTGCGSASSDSAAMETSAGYDYSDDIYTKEAAVPATEAVTEEFNDMSDAGSGETETVEVSDDRKLVKTVNMDVETEEFDQLIANVEQKITSLGGYAQNKEIGGRSYYNTDGERYASVTARIPSDKLDDFVTAIAAESNVTSKNESVDDVTLQYVDIEAHRDSLRTEQERLNELLEKADSIETIVALEDRLAEVRYQLESYESQLRTMDNQVEYSTVYLYISEVERLTPQVEKTPWERISSGFSESLYNVGKGLQNFLIGFIIALPYIFMFAVVIAFIVGVILLSVKKAEKRSKKKMMIRQTKQTKQEPADKAEGK